MKKLVLGSLCAIMATSAMAQDVSDCHKFDKYPHYMTAVQELKVMMGQIDHHTMTQDIYNKTVDSLNKNVRLAQVASKEKAVGHISVCVAHEAKALMAKPVVKTVPMTKIQPENDSVDKAVDKTNKVIAKADKTIDQAQDVVDSAHKTKDSASHLASSVKSLF